VFAETREERVFLHVGRHLSKHFQPKITTLELPLAEVTPLGEGDRLIIPGSHLQGVTVDEILRKHVGSGSVKVIGRLKVQVVGKDLQHLRSALVDVVRQKFDTIGTHQSEKGVVLPFKAGLPKLELDGGELAPQHLDEEVPAPACRLQKAGVNPLGLSFNKVKHCLDHPRGGEHLPVINNAFLGFDQIYGPMHFGRCLLLVIAGYQVFLLFPGSSENSIIMQTPI
jgi:hypothetical protein